MDVCGCFVGPKTILGLGPSLPEASHVEASGFSSRTIGPSGLAVGGKVVRRAQQADSARQCPCWASELW